MHFATIGGITLHHEHQAGDAGKPLVVFVNSLGTDFRIWDAVLLHFAASGFPTLRYDKRGHGLSALGSPPYAMDQHVGDLAGLLDHVGAKDVVVVGLSVGGLIAQGIAVRRPETVRALVLCDTAHRIGTVESWNDRIATVRDKGVAVIADAVLKNWFTPAFFARRAAELAGCRAMLTRQSVDGYAGTCAALRDADHTELVQRIAVPTLCLVGDQDGSTPPALVKAMAELIPGARFEIIPDAGHIPCIEQPDDLFARIQRFLETNGLGANRHD